MPTLDLLIIYRDGTKHTVSNVSAYGYNGAYQNYYFEKNGRKSFAPRESIAFWGSAFDYEDKKG